MPQTRVDELDKKFKVTIKNSNGLSVSAPLPDDFGFTVGSVFSTPFDVLSLSETTQKAFALAKVSQKFAVNMEKAFINPEPTEISFEMHFDAYYDAVDEVLTPVIKLLNMGMASKYTTEKAKEEIAFALSKIGGKADEAAGTEGTGETLTGFSNSVLSNGVVEGTSSKVLEFLDVIGAPNKITVSFGEVLRMRDAYISSIGTSFSNSLDVNGVPMHARCAITIVLANVPLVEDINGSNDRSPWFRGRK